MNLIATDNKRVIVGLGLTGMSCARYFSRKKQVFSVVDSRNKPPGLEQFKQQFPDVPITLGVIGKDDLLDADQLVVSPGVALDEPAIAQAIEHGVKVCGDIDLFCEQACAPVIAITGSNGKSTVTTLLGKMFTQAGKRVAVGGNIGIPALDLLDDSEPDYYVLELSSFQLERAGNLNVALATVLNISADHMDRYSSLLPYHQAKHRIFRGCKKVLINRADPLSRPLVAEDVERWTFSLDKPDFKGFGLIKENGFEFLAFEFERLMPVSELKIAGRHNIENALAALALGKAAGLLLAPMLEVLKTFTGLPHRCQFVAESHGVCYYNDSKGTNVGAAIAAVTGLASSAKKVVLIAGGDAKGADFSPLLATLDLYARGVVLIGEAAQQLQQLLKGKIKLLVALTMDEAVAQARKLAQPGDAVLLSPACASFDMFDNYQHRGDVFTQSVLAMTSGRAN
ncbi:MAG: UDP-N-acetylmuramoyl-L-alanine--D-glutamate ligase [Spongiibacteraceae bacterium]|nr:UDP-N-acetylmuramoyl-L-alanine--D-glutamate ligase [Spongiibacteraceae bacterium]